MSLAGTTWLINTTPSISSTIQYSINFTSNGTNYDSFKLKLIVGYKFINYFVGESYIIPWNSRNGWRLGEDYRTIHITGGSDVETSSLISWLNSNATQIIEDDTLGYVGVNNQSSKITKGYVGVGGQARKLVKGYIGVNNQAKKIF